MHIKESKDTVKQQQTVVNKNPQMGETKRNLLCLPNENNIESMGFMVQNKFEILVVQNFYFFL